MTGLAAVDVAGRAALLVTACKTARLGISRGFGPVL
jgi:hypothetical protein